MTYYIYLTQATAEAKAELAKHFEMCECCEGHDVRWLTASNTFDRISIHGIGHVLTNAPTPEKACRFYVADALTHGNTVILTPDMNEFIGLINKYLK